MGKLKELASKRKKKLLAGKRETFEVIVQLHSVVGLDKALSGHYVFWAWKRGQHTGTTLKTNVNAGKAEWDDSSVNLQCSMVPHKKLVGQYENKLLVLTLKEVRDWCWHGSSGADNGLFALVLALARFRCEL